MSDKLGIPGQRREHLETLAARHEAVAAIRSGSTWSKAAIGISVVSALISWLSYQAAERANDAARLSHFLDRRIETCADLQIRADNILNASSVLAGELTKPLTETREERVQLHQSYWDFEQHRVLYMLGPQRLAEAEGDLAHALFNVNESVRLGERTEESVRAAVVEADMKVSAFRVACIEAVGSYRDGPTPIQLRPRGGASSNAAPDSE